MSAEYLKPKLNESFGKAAEAVMRDCMAYYDKAPPEVKSLLENLAIYQSFEMMGTPLKPNLTELPTSGNT